MKETDRSAQEIKSDLFLALQVLDALLYSSWHKTGVQEYRCNACGGIGSYPRSIKHAADCKVEEGASLVGKYRLT